MKYGAPIAEVSTPTGTSSGANAVRAIKSAAMTIPPPTKAETGRSDPKDEPTNRLAICGAIKPTTPIPHANATAIPATEVLRVINMKRSR